MAKKVWVKKDTCIACGVCPAIASAIFIIGNDGLAENQLGDTVPDDLVALAKEAEESCPVQAIVVED